MTDGHKVNAIKTTRRNRVGDIRTIQQAMEEYSEAWLKRREREKFREEVILRSCVSVDPA